MNKNRQAWVLAGLLIFTLCALAPRQVACWDPGEKIGMDTDWVPLTDKPDQKPAPSPEPQRGEVWKEPVTGMEFVYVPGGCYMQGSPLTEVGRYEDESPQHKTCVSGFWIGKYEVTNAQYRKFDPEHTSKKYQGHDLNGGTQPAVYVSWYEAMSYAKWLTEKNNGQYVFWLPTEAEWEYACRGGTTTSRFWGDDPAKACEYANGSDLAAKQVWKDWNTADCNDGFVATSPVGSFKPNPLGLYDMMGNAWEWCQDWRGPYPPGPLDNPYGVPSSEEGRIVRGGSWDNMPAGLRSANRSYGTPNFRRYNDGFRLVRTR